MTILQVNKNINRKGTEAMKEKQYDFTHTPIDLDDPQTKLSEYAELLLKKDQLLKEAASYQIAFTREFGELIVKNFELKLECIREKKTISYCRRRLNRGLPIDTAKMKAEIEQEMKLYCVQLKELIQENKDARDAKKAGQFEVSRAKKIYRRLAKLLHPDINKKTQADETLQDLWTRIVDAYQRSDVDELEELEVLTRKVLDDLGEAAFDFDTGDLDRKINKVERWINEILSTEPYTYGELLSDPEKKESYRDQLKAEAADYKEYLNTLKKELDEMLSENGAKIIWR